MRTLLQLGVGALRSCVSGVNLEVLYSFTHPVCPEPVCTSLSSGAEHVLEVAAGCSSGPANGTPVPRRRENVDPGHTGLEPQPAVILITLYSSNDLLILSLRAAHLLLFQLTGTFPVVDLVLIESRVDSGATRCLTSIKAKGIVRLRSPRGLGRNRNLSRIRILG